MLFRRYERMDYEIPKLQMKKINSLCIVAFKAALLCEIMFCIVTNGKQHERRPRAKLSSNMLLLIFCFIFILTKLF